MIDLYDAFSKTNQDFLRFDLVEEKLHSRSDIHAYLFLDKLVPTETDRPIVSAAQHDEIFLDVDCDKLAQVATEDDIRQLTRCGIRYSAEYNSLCKFA